MVSEVVEVYADNNSSEMFGAEAATLVWDKLVIWAVWDQLIVCDVKYVEWECVDISTHISTICNNVTYNTYK